MKHYHYILGLIQLIGFTNIYSQDNNLGTVFSPPKNPCDIYTKEHIGSRHFIPYTHLREGDVSWEKRIWRDIDMREKQNQPLYYPIEPNACRTSLFQALVKQILTHNIIAFADEDF